GCYVTGLSYLARTEAGPVKGNKPLWPMFLLLIPLLLAFANENMRLMKGILPVVAATGWISWTLICHKSAKTPNMGQTVSRLLAGIVLIDWVAAPIPFAWLPAVFLAFFGLALLLQRTVPAT